MVSLTFGLVRDLPSRGLVDEDEEEAMSKRTYFLHMTDSSVTAKALIVTACKLSNAFVSVYVRGDKPVKIGRIVETTTLGDERSTDETVATIYHERDGIIHCQVQKQIHQEWQNEFCDAVFGLNFDQNLEVIVLASDRLANFRFCPDNFELRDDCRPITRSLRTSKFKCTKCPIKTLDQPNLVQGIPASVLTHCQFNLIPSLLVASYTDTDHPDSLSLSGFKEIFDVKEVRRVVGSEVDPTIVKDRLKKMSMTGNQFENQLFL